MAKISFNLNRGLAINDKSSEYPIYVRVILGRRLDVSVSLKHKIRPDHWNKENQEVRSKSQISDRRIVVNTLINSCRSNLTRELAKMEIENKEITRELIKNVIKKSIDLKTRQQDGKEAGGETFFSFFKKFISESRAKPGTIKTYKVTYNLVEKFDKKTNFDDITLDWYYRFVEWSQEKNHSKNYIGKNIKVIKTVMGDALEQGETNNAQFLNKKFQVLREEVKEIYLNIDELRSMHKLDLSYAPKLDQARDIFLVGAFTGLRVSDYNQLKQENLISSGGIKMIRVKIKKTGKLVAIPLHPVVKDILKKYNNSTPPKMPDQQINRLIKQVGEMAGIDSMESITITKGGVSITTRIMKCDLIKTHTARRSFCTNAYASDMSAVDIMTISGHTSEKNFLNYIKSTAEEKAIRLSRKSFFNPTNIE